MQTRATQNRRILFFCACSLLLFASLAATAAKLKQVALIDLPGNPGFNQVALANGEVIITRPEANTVEIFNPVKRRVVARISQVDSPRGVAVDDANFRVYIALAGSNRIAVVNSKNWQVEKLVPVSHPPEKLLWVGKDSSLYVTSLRGRCITTVDPESGEETATVDVEALPQDMLYDGPRQKLVVSLQDRNEIALLDHSNKITGTFKLAGSEPTGLALDEAKRRLYVAVRYAVLILNADTGAEISRIAAPGGTDTVVLDSANSLLYAAAGDGSVIAIDLAKGVADHELPTDVKGYTIAYDPNRKMLFLPGGREGRAKLVILRPVGVGEASAPQTAANPTGAGQTALKK
ncbi:MAG TPA: YncE family protein [Candidatus Angelobacter sp.]|nr:YncE family protein [Candidatus Angelobacter sp.]